MGNGNLHKRLLSRFAVLVALLLLTAPHAAATATFEVWTEVDVYLTGITAGGDPVSSLSGIEVNCNLIGEFSELYGTGFFNSGWVVDPDTGFGTWVPLTGPIPEGGSVLVFSTRSAVDGGPLFRVDLSMHIMIPAEHSFITTTILIA